MKNAVQLAMEIILLWLLFLPTKEQLWGTDCNSHLSSFFSDGKRGVWDLSSVFPEFVVFVFQPIDWNHRNPQEMLPNSPNFRLSKRVKYDSRTRKYEESSAWRGNFLIIRPQSEKLLGRACEERVLEACIRAYKEFYSHFLGRGFILSATSQAFCGWI